MFEAIAVVASVLLAIFILSTCINASGNYEYKKLRYLLRRGYRIYQVEPTVLIMSRARDERKRIGKGQEPAYPAISIDEAYEIVRKQEGYHVSDEGGLRDARRQRLGYKDQPSADRLDWSDEDLSQPPKYTGPGAWK